MGGWRSEREVLLKEILQCKGRIQAISQEALEWELTRHEYEQKISHLQELVEDANTTRAACSAPLQRWRGKKTSVWDISGQTPAHDHMEDPYELILTFLESERLYLNSLTILDTHYQQPMRMLSAFKPDVLSLQQLEILFLNCSELLNLHRYLFEELHRIPRLPRSIQLDQFLSILERMFPCLSLYNPFMDSSRSHNLTKELRQLKQKPEFSQLLAHCDMRCDGHSLELLLSMPSERFNEYSSLLTLFLSLKLRDVSDEVVQRADSLNRFLRSMKYELLDEKSDWDHALEKIKLLQRLDPASPIPLEIFNSNVHLVKQGQLNQVITGGKEVPRFCYLFTNYIALAEADKYLRILEHGMIPLCGAQLHKTVDVEGQALEPDLQSGRLEDRLGFLVSFAGHESLFFRVSKPSLWKSWVESLDKCIQESHHQHVSEADDIPFTPLYPDVGPKIAAASLEKLFQQLTSPHTFQDDFVGVFLTTHPSFTTSHDVLIALINCMQSPQQQTQQTPPIEGSMSDMASQVSGNGVFSFSMESEVLECDRLSTTNVYSDIDQLSLNSPLPSRHRSNAMATNSGRMVVPVRTSLSTSDSDVSPHTSAIVEGTDSAMGSLHNGWSGGVSLKIPRGAKHTNAMEPDADYLVFYRRSRTSSELEFGDNEDSGNEEETDTSKQSITNSSARNKVKTSISTKRTLSELSEVSTLMEQTRSIEEEEEEEEEEVEEEKEDTISDLSLTHSQRMNLELDAASTMLEKLTESLFTMGAKGGKTVNNVEKNDRDFTTSYQEDAGSVERRSRMSGAQSRSLRQSVMSVSLSEPDLTQVGLPDSATPPPPVPPHRQFAVPVRTSSIQRPGTPTDKFSNSLTVGHACHSPSASPFLRGKAMMSPTHRYLISSNGGGGAGGSGGGESPVHSGDDRFSLSGKHKSRGKSSERSVMSRFRKGGSVKRTDATATPARFGGKAALLTKSSSAFFPNGTEHSTKVTKLARNEGGGGGGLKGIWKRNSRKKSQKTSSAVESEEGVDSGVSVDTPPREPRRSLSLRRKNSFTGDLKVNQLETLAERSRSPLLYPRCMNSTTRGCLPLVTKILQVLDYWQDVHFEDFGEDSSLYHMLEDFLHGLITRNPADSKEAIAGHNLLKEVTRKSSLYSTDSSFSGLLTRIYHLDPDLVKHYTWNSNQKLIIGREIDLSRPITKDGNTLKIIAEQMTLMEFAVYKSVRRVELMNVNWKKSDREQKAASVCRLIRRTNEMTSWVCTEILTRDSPSARATVIEHFIQIALYCYRHNDMHCSLNVTIALSSSIIRGLRKSWEEVDRKYRDKFKKLRDLTDYQGRCRKLRERLERVTLETHQKTGDVPAALPYIGAYLDQIYSLEMTTPTYSKDGLVNFTKMNKLADLIGRTLVYQRTRFKFEPRLDIIAYITGAKRLSENELYELSSQREPNSRSSQH